MMDVNVFCIFNYVLYSYKVIYFMCMVIYVIFVYLYVFYVDLYFVLIKVDLWLGYNGSWEVIFFIGFWD